MPFKEDLFNRIVNVGWRTDEDYVVLLLGTTQANDPTQIPVLQKLVASVVVGTGVDAFTVPLVNGDLDLSQKLPAIGGPPLAPQLSGASLGVEITAAIKAFYKHFSIWAPLNSNGYGIDPDNNPSAGCIALFLRTKDLRATFGPLLTLTLNFTINPDYTTNVYALFFQGQLFNFKALNSFEAQFDDNLPRGEAFTVEAQTLGIPFNFNIVTGPIPASQFVFALNLTNYQIAQIAP